MRVFAQLAASGSFTAAAAELGVTKQTVSRRVQGLEQTLGVHLVQRTTRSVALTEVGRAYAARCAEVSRLADEANRAAASQLQMVAGSLRVSAVHSLSEPLLQPLLTRFCAAFPQVSLELVLTPRKVDLLEERFDVAFRVGAPPDVHHLASRWLAPAQLWTVAAPAYLRARGTPQTPDALQQHSCLAALPNPAQRAWPFSVHGSMRLLPVSPRILSNDAACIHAAALAGLGVGHLPSFMVMEDLERGRLVRVLEGYTPEVGGLHAVYAHSKLLAPKVSEFVGMAVDEARRVFAVG